MASGEKTLGKHTWGPGGAAARNDIQGDVAAPLYRLLTLGPARCPETSLPTHSCPPLPWWQGDWFRNFPFLEPLMVLVNMLSSTGASWWLQTPSVRVKTGWVGPPFSHMLATQEIVSCTWAGMFACLAH